MNNTETFGRDGDSIGEFFEPFNVFTKGEKKRKEKGITYN
jgi:hypothetical protein